MSGAPKQVFVELVKPDQAAFEADVARFELELKRLDQTVESCEAEIAARSAASSANRAIAEEARAKFAELRNEQDLVKKEKDGLFEQLAKLSGGPKGAPGSAPGSARGAGAAAGAGGKPVAADRPKYKSEAEVQARIQALLDEQASETMSLPAEKALLKQITDLRAIKGSFRATAAAAEAARAEADLSKQSRAEIKARLEVVKAEHAAVSARVTAQKEIMTKLAPRDDTIRELNDKKFAAKKAGFEKRKELKAFRDAFYQSKKEFFEWQRAEYVRKDAQRLAQQLAWQRSKEAEAAAATAEVEVEEEEEEGHPWATEMEECSRLMSHLVRQKTTAELPAPVAASAAAPAKGRKKGLHDDDSFDHLSGKLDARASKPQRPSTYKPKMSYPIELLSLFTKFGLDAPTSFDAFDATLEALAAKKEEYSTMPAPVKQPKIPAAAAARSSSSTARTSVQTPYGKGVVVLVRDDGVLVVHMEKFEATAYLQQSQVKLVPRPRPSGPPSARAPRA